jgi:ERCC4-related helicase
MSSKEQQAVMGLFRQPGARLLVSTAAGEEGMDVPRCELVVRYSATQTGGGDCVCDRGRGEGSRMAGLDGS